MSGLLVQGLRFEGAFPMLRLRSQVFGCLVPGLHVLKFGEVCGYRLPATKVDLMRLDPKL